MIYRHTEEDMEMFLQQSRYLLEAAIKRAGTQSRKKGWELHFETGVLGELAAVSQAAAKAAAAAAMTAACVAKRACRSVKKEVATAEKTAYHDTCVNRLVVWHFLLDVQRSVTFSWELERHVMSQSMSRELRE